MENKAFDDIELQRGAARDKESAAANTVAIREAEELQIDHDGPYAGMGKEDLLKYSQGLHWRVTRAICLFLLTAGWFVMFAMAIFIIVTTPKCLPWWQLSTFYQIYPRSFYDSNGDGIGDLKGIAEKADYLSGLGIGAVLLNSIYASSNYDFGYDVTDFMAVDKKLGTMKDFEDMLNALHERDIKVVLDFIPNHSSVEHKWFTDEEKSEDYYTWTNDANNWVSVYSGSAWTPHTNGKSYLHQYSKYQPDLNFANRDVQDELESALEEWFIKGVDGFNMHGMKYLYEIEDLADEPVNSDFSAANDPEQYDSLNHWYTAEYEGHSEGTQHDVLHRWRKGLFDKFSTAGTYRVMMSDSDSNASYAQTYYGTTKRREVDMPQNLNLMKLGDSLGGAGTTPGRKVEKLIKKWMTDLPDEKWPNFVMGNHEVHRVASRLAPKYDRAANMLLLTLPGTPICYYGDEIGMTDIELTEETTLDIRAKNDIDQWKKKTRDPARSPMQWSNDTNGGFSTSSNGTWLPVNENYQTGINVQDMEDADWSVLHMFKRLIELRKTKRAFQSSKIQYVLANDEVVSYIRKSPGDAGTRYLVAINFGAVDSEADYFNIDDSLPIQGTVIVSTEKNRMATRGGRVELNKLPLAPGEGLVIQLDTMVDVPDGATYLYEYFRPSM